MNAGALKTETALGKDYAIKHQKRKLDELNYRILKISRIHLAV
jgi:hypothetical protein